ncbi:MAG: UDP-N-acetylmuramoyl-L-alanine--D-glutamate ligase [Gammaproteobacteria bacterium]
MVRDLNVIVGLGATGISCARYLQQQGIPFGVTDSRTNPPNLDEFKSLFPNVPCEVGKIDEGLLNRANRLIVSPGVSLQEPAIAQAVAKGIPAIGDIELFAVEARAPVIAITGTNAKSTVTTLVGEMADAAGKSVQVGGNLGTPALDLLTTPRPELFVLELSSFQLETTYSLAPAVATILNVTPDHMDRYGSLEQYCLAKQRIYSHCQVAVCNRDDPLTECREPDVKRILYFTLNEPRDNEFGLTKKGNDNYLAFQNQILMPVRDLPILGRHYQANALAALAIGYGFGLPFEPMLQTLIDFKGLPHRCQLVRERNGVLWYNDSKGTNVGATLAAIDGLGSEINGKLILIAGGVGKNADFAPLVPAIEKYVKTVVLIGEAATVLANVIGDRVDIVVGKSMADAIELADHAASQGDSVLLSPACASFDMFNNFEHRGEVFTEIVKNL